MNQQQSGENRGSPSQGGALARQEAGKNRALAALEAADNLSGGLSVAGMLRGAISGQGYAAGMAGATLSGDVELVTILAAMNTYKMSGGVRSPQQDLNALSSGSLEDVEGAVRRLNAAFFEARHRLGAALGVVEGSERGGIVATFIVINAGYALVLNTVHLLLTRRSEGEWAPRLAPLFEDLLESDAQLDGVIQPSLSALVEPFRRLREAAGQEARETALGMFFGTFCDLCGQRELADEKFSTMVQAMLLRQLVQLLKDEKGMSAAERRLAPELIHLFDKRLRAELSVAQGDEQGEQPVIGALRRCRLEGRALFETLEEFLTESVDSVDGGRRRLALAEETMVGAQVVLSAGCLLPETGCAVRLNRILDRVSKLHPDLTVIYVSALRFDRYADLAGGSYAPIVDSAAIVARGVAAYAEAQPVLKKLLREDLFLKLPQEFVAVLSRDSGRVWLNLGKELRRQLVENVLVHQIAPETPGSAPLGGEDAAHMAVLFVTHLELENAELKALPAAVFPWLGRDGIFCGLDQDKQRVILRAMLKKRESLATVGTTEEDLKRLLAKGEVGAIVELAQCAQLYRGDSAKAFGYRELLAQALSSCPAGDLRDETLIKQAFQGQLYAPLGRRLEARFQLAAEKHRLDETIGKAQGRLNELESDAIRMRLLDSALAALREDETYILAARAVRILEGRRSAVQERLNGLLAGDAESRVVNRSKIDKQRGELDACTAQLEEKLKQEIPVPEEHREAIRKDGILFREFAGFESTAKTLRAKIEPLIGQRDEAAGRLTEINSQQQAINAGIERFFALFREAIRSEVLMQLSSEELRFAHADSDLVGGFCALLVSAERIRSGAGAVQREEIVRLEGRLRAACAVALEDPVASEDVLLVLHGLVDLVKEERPVLSWPELMEGIKNGAEPSLIAYLFSMMRAEALGGLRRSFLDRPIGWSEAFHGPLLLLFAFRSERTRNAVEASRCASLVAHVLPAWVQIEKRRELFRLEDAELPEEERRTLPESGVTLDQALRALAAPLRLSSGVVSKKSAGGDRLEADLRDCCAALFEWGQKRMPEMSDLEFANIIMPLGSAVERGVKRRGSLLRDPQVRADEFLATVRAREAGIRRQYEEVRRAAEKSIPPAPQAMGLDEAKIRLSRLGLGAPDGSVPRLGRDEDVIDV